MRLTTGVAIAAPRDVVYARALDIEGWSSIISGVTSIELLTPGPVIAGPRFRETRNMFGREASEEMTFEEIDSGRGSSWAHSAMARATAPCMFLRMMGAGRDSPWFLKGPRSARWRGPI